MSHRPNLNQASKSLNNPLNLGTFSSTSLRYLKGSLGPQNKVVGRADTHQLSNGGFGGGTYNHWYSITLESPGWIIATKGPPRPKYINTSTYDLNKTPIEGRAIFDADSISDGLKSNNEVYVPYLDTMIGAQSALYNQFSQVRLDRGDERYYPLEKGTYLLCISSTRNEPLSYEIGVVIEFPATQVLIELEDNDSSIMLQESGAPSILIPNPLQTTLILPSGSYVVGPTPYIIESPGLLGITDPSVVEINTPVTANNTGNFGFLCDIGDEEYFDTVHDHSLSEWQTSWEREHQDTDRFPEVFVALTNRP